jgi:starch synthase
MDVKKVLFISQEIYPYLPESPIANVGRYLPQGIQEKGIEVRAFMPKYGAINDRTKQLHEVIRLSGRNIVINDSDHPLIIKVATLSQARMQIYFIYNDDYFTHNVTKELETTTSPEDNDERSIFFVRGVMDTVKKFGWDPDIIHCHGWLSSLAPIFTKKSYADDPCFRNSKIVVSLYDNKFTRPFDARFAEKIIFRNITPADIPFASGEEIDFITLNKFAIDYADGVIAGSEDIDQSLIDYALEKGKLFLPYQPEEGRTEAIEAFYEQVWNSNNQ